MPHKLLLADASVTTQRDVALAFANEDVEVIALGDGRQAIERIKSERPDVVLAAIGMPERDGYEVAAFLKADPELSHIPVLLLTGAFEPLDERRAHAAGCDGVLIKPLEPQLVVKRVRQLLAGRPQPQAAGPSAPPGSAGGASAGWAGAEVAQKRRGDALEEYFDRLDAAFANAAVRGSVRPAPAEGAAAPESAPPTAHSAHEDIPDPELVVPPSPMHQAPLANAFAALLAAEQGRPAPPSALAGAVPVTISEETIEEIVRRVIARMSDEPMRRLVLDAAERLVREEIERIKGRGRPSEPRG